MPKEKISQNQIDNRKSDYVCFNCGIQFISKEQKKKELGYAVTFFEDNCGLCGDFTGVTNIRHYNYLRKTTK